jgi:cyclic pyranopterin phosphate synthase
MPPEGMQYADKTNYLTSSQLVRFVSAAARLGVKRVRLTGGEPLLRRDVVDIVRALRAIDTPLELNMTTNGSRLEQLAAPLRSAGLAGLNISLDSLDPERFNEVTRVAQYDRVRRGIDAAFRVGFRLKLNTVVLDGMTDDEILEFAQLAFDHDIDVRFLEFMPLCGTAWQRDLVYPIDRVREIVRQRFTLAELPRGDHPAQTFSLTGGKGRVGFIAPLTEPFCGACSRMRLTADGKIRPCLFSDYEVDVARLLRDEARDDALIEAIQSTVWRKPWGSEFNEQPFATGEAAEREVFGGPLIRGIGG